MANYKLTCSDCGHTFPEDDYYIGCPKCGGFLEILLDEIPENPVDNTFDSIFKYHPMMPYDPVNQDITMFEDCPDTPTEFAPRLSEQLDIEVYFKDETVLPSGTWKDREGFISVYRMLINKVPDLFVFSSGNTGTSLARSATIMQGPRLHLVIPEASRQRLGTYKEFFHPDFVKVHYHEGSNDECIVEAKRLSAQMGIPTEGGFTNYARREGLKLLGLEAILGWGEKVDWYVQAVAGGIGLYSYLKAYRDLGREDECPKMLGVQAEICNPMVAAWKAGSQKLEEKYVPATVAPSDYVRVLRTRRPADSYPILKPIMDQVNGRFEDVSDKQIHEALRFFYMDDYYRNRYRNHNCIVGLEPATALAGVVKGVREGYIRKGDKVLLNVSGAAKMNDIRMEWISDLL